MAKRKNRRPPAEAPLAAVARPAEPRPTFYVERQPGGESDYEIRLSLDGQALCARISPPGGQAFELARRDLGGAARSILSDARFGFGVPEGVDGRVMRELLWECRLWIRRDAARRAIAARQADPGASQ
ncbi:MAG: hypothetical protein BWZ10_01330 [candidate division BRC1 bacterium ADurb.BinA364]|nr:MAG: hypothetical protein BWZ10_01330 [candidate division BRC1 bacterium ADurb.BinA364]